MWDKKLGLLFEFFEIDPMADGSWEALACALAIRHVPGFQLTEPKRKRGAKRKWDRAEQLALIDAIDRQRTASKRVSLKAAIRAAMKSRDWRWGKDSTSVESRYYEARKNISTNHNWIGGRAGVLGLQAHWIDARVRTKAPIK